MCERIWTLPNHADGIAAIDLFVLPTIAFRILYCLVIIRHGRRIWVSFGVTENPTAEWISRQYRTFREPPFLALSVEE